MKFMYVAQTVILMHMPSVGPVAGGTIVSISGANFPLMANLSCSFGTSFLSAHVLSSTLLRCTSPPSNVSASVPLVLRQENVTISSGMETFVYEDKAILTSISPTYCLDSGDQQITVKGTHFPRNGDFWCKFGADC